MVVGYSAEPSWWIRLKIDERVVVIEKLLDGFWMRLSAYTPQVDPNVVAVDNFALNVVPKHPGHSLRMRPWFPSAPRKCTPGECGYCQIDVEE